MNTYQPIAFISSPNLSVLKETLDSLNLSHAEVNGVYKGVPEKSLLVVLNDNDDLSIIKELGLVHGQESILYVDSNRFGSLEYMSGKSIPLGLFRAVAKEIAIAQDCYTEINGLYYVTQK